MTQGSHSTWATTYVNLGSALSKLGQYKEACDSYRKVLEIDPRHATALALTGKNYMFLGDFDSAILKFHEVRKEELFSFLLLLFFSFLFLSSKSRKLYQTRRHG